MIALLLTCAFAAVIPHGHDCGAADCAICATLETSRELLLVLTLVCGAELVLQSYAIRSVNTEGLSIFDETLVALKVKLSD